MAKIVAAYSGTTWGSYATENNAGSSVAVKFTAAKHADGTPVKPTI